MKRGVSNVIATLLIIGLGIAMSSVLFVVLMNMKSFQLSPEEICLEEKIIIKEVCYNNETKDLEIEITKKNTKEIKEINFNIKYEKESIPFVCCESCKECKILEKGSKKYYIQTGKIPEEIFVVADNCRGEKRSIDFC
jgi:hypothetical protein